MSHRFNSRNESLAPSELALDDVAQVTLCEVLDRVLNKGVVIAGDATISVADVDLIYLGLQIVLTSIETARKGSCESRVEFGNGMAAVKENEHGIAGSSGDRV